ncbi:MAG: bile acid:sodium symporter family protein [Saprospiraceae bacterium]|nr:bile acid:sodium symporter family protein [Saprospiraceae bacterium]
MKNYFFTIAIVLAATIALIAPQYFIEINGFKLKTLIVPLLQIIMFGMGTTMTLADFRSVAQTPKAVFVGLVCQFIIMPFVGFGLATLFKFPPEIAAGILLIGCSPSGLASNVMAYIAKANVALSITITSCATLLAPILTPTLMKLLAGQFIDISFESMMLDILKMVIAPILVGLLVNYAFKKYTEVLNRILPIVSMAGIAIIIVIITAAGRDALLSIGGLLIVVVLIHNLSGYLLGYWGGRLLGMPEQDCRTIAIEVGLQNAGLASGLALSMGKVATVGLASALFGPIMNTTGSLLATWWGKRPPQ